MGKTSESLTLATATQTKKEWTLWESERRRRDAGDWGPLTEASQARLEHFFTRMQHFLCSVKVTSPNLCSSKGSSSSSSSSSSSYLFLKGGPASYTFMLFFFLSLEVNNVLPECLTSLIKSSYKNWCVDEFNAVELEFDWIFAGFVESELGCVKS